MIFQFSVSVPKSKENRILLLLPDQIFQKRQMTQSFINQVVQQMCLQTQRVIYRVKH